MVNSLIACDPVEPAPARGDEDLPGQVKTE